MSCGGICRNTPPVVPAEPLSFLFRTQGVSQVRPRRPRRHLASGCHGHRSHRRITSAAMGRIRTSAASATGVVSLQSLQQDLHGVS